MKLKIVIVLLILAVWGIWEHRAPQPVIIEGDIDGRRYFCVYEVNKGEDYEQVESAVRKYR